MSIGYYSNGKVGVSMAVLDCPVLSQSWKQAEALRNGRAGLSGIEASEDVLNDSAWGDCLTKIAHLQHLGEAWDGDSAKCPSAEIVASTIGLAELFCRRAVPAPSRVAPGIGGEVILEWQFPDGTYAEVEVVRPYFAEVMVVEPDRSTKHWTLPTE